MRASSTPANTARRSRPQRGGNEPGRSCRAVALVRIPQREYQPRRCRRHQRSHGVVGNCYHTKRRTRQEPRRARPHDRRTAPLRSRRRRTPSRCHGGTAKRPRSRCEPAARTRTQRRSASPRRGGTPRGAARMSGGDGGNRTPVRRWCNRTSPGAVRWRFSQPRRLTRTRTPTGSVTWMFQGPR